VPTHTNSRPRVSVLVTTYLGHERIQRCLDSLAAQTLPASEFEIVVVQNGPACPTPEVAEAFAATHPGLSVRVVETAEQGVGNARNLGLQAARGDFVTYVDDDDWVSPGYLAGLLAHARPGVIPAAPIADVAEGREDSEEGSFDNYYVNALRPHWGKLIEPVRAVPSVSVNGGKLLPAELARSVEYDVDLRSGEDWVYLLELYSREQFKVAVLHPDDGAVYHRVLRAGSNGRQVEDYDFLVTQRLACMKAVLRADRSKRKVATLSDLLTSTQAIRINDHLRAHPEDRDRVVAEIRELGLERPHWPVINDGLAQDLALVYLFPQALDTSGLVAARRLRERGLVTDVISQELAGVRGRDPSAASMVSEVVGTHIVLPDDPDLHDRTVFESWRAVRTYAEQALAEVNRLQAEKGKYRSVYSRAMAVHSHYAAAMLKLQQPEIHWTAEFSDPMRVYSNGAERLQPMGDDWLGRATREALRGAGVDLAPDAPFFGTAEYLAYALADEIVLTNPNQLEVMMGYAEHPALVERARSRARVDVHPTLPERFYSMRPSGRVTTPGKVNIGYFGVFYGVRGLGDVVEAIRRLPLAARNVVRLHAFVDDPEQLQTAVIADEVADVVIPHPFLRYLRFLNATTKFEALLVNDYVTRGHHALNPYLPAKLADYLGSGSPIWSIVEPGSVMSGIATDYRSEVGDVDGAVEAINAIVRDHHS